MEKQLTGEMESLRAEVECVQAELEEYRQFKKENYQQFWDEEA